MKRLLRTIVAVVLGYAAMVLLITLLQETWLGGVGWNESSLGILLVAGLFTALAAAVGAVLATAIAHGGRIPAAIMALLVAIETTALTVTGRTSGPLWFDMLAAATLIAAIVIGAELFLLLRRKSALTPR